MICKNCGTQLPDNVKFCTKCGTPTAEDFDISAAGVERAVPRGFSAKKNIIIIIIAAILLIGGGITAIAVVNSHSASSGITDKLQLAERYLNEQNYEQAVIEFQKVLEIEPMNVDAYLGIADAYMGMGDTDKALEWLNKGLEQTGDARVQARIDALTKPFEPGISELGPAVIEPTESETSEPEVLAYGSMGFVTILGEEYDVATTTHLKHERMGITDTQLKEIAKLTNLTELGLESNQISDITPLAKLNNLKFLYLGDNQVSDITPLATFTNLTSLSLGGNQINDITPLAELTNLTSLSMYNTHISNITPLANLTNLTGLDLSDNQISDIMPLTNLTNLTILRLQDNRISDITLLSNLTNLTTLDLSGNQISDEDIEKLKTQLPNCDIYF